MSSNVMRHTLAKPTADPDYLTPGWYFSRDHETINIIMSFDKDEPEILHAKQVLSSGELSADEHTVLLQELYAAARPSGPPAPLLAPTLDALLDQIDGKVATIRPSGKADMSPKLLERAETIVRVIDNVNLFVENCWGEWKKQDDSDKAQQEAGAVVVRKRFGRTKAIKDALETLGTDRVGLVSYFEYRKLYFKGNGDPVQIASRLHRSTYQKSGLPEPEQHLLDKIIMHFLGGYLQKRSADPADGSKTKGLRALPPLRPIAAFRLMQSVLVHTGNMWVNPALCSGSKLENLADELLDAARIPDVLTNPDKQALLVRVKCPSRAHFYEHLNWYVNQPGKGKELITARYGKELWEHEFLAFDSFVREAKLPLQFVVGDHHMIKVFVKDDRGGKHLVKLWVTMLIDAYSRSVLGMSLSKRGPSVESIQSALRHAIWPKDPANDIEWVKGETPLQWTAYGIPKLLSLDNAWAHHSLSLETLAKQISMNGKFTRMDLLHRPPYKARWGGLIERLFRNFKGQIKDLLPGAILSDSPADRRAAANQATLLFDDVYDLIYRLILNYQHTKHSEIQMTPHQKFIQGMNGRLPKVPALDEGVDRLFWHLYPATRTIGRNGLSAFGLKYSVAHINHLPRVDMNGRKIGYSFRFQESDISRLAVFDNDTWVGDVLANRYKEPDGTTRPTNLWHLETANNMYDDDKDVSTTPDPLSITTRVKHLTKLRNDEDARAMNEAARAAAGIVAPGQGVGTKKPLYRGAVSLEKGVTPEQMQSVINGLPTSAGSDDEAANLMAFVKGR